MQCVTDLFSVPLHKKTCYYVGNLGVDRLEDSNLNKLATELLNRSNSFPAHPVSSENKYIEFDTPPSEFILFQEKLEDEKYAYYFIKVKHVSRKHHLRQGKR